MLAFQHELLLMANEANLLAWYGPAQLGAYLNRVQIASM
uniref:Uncharacterized protein n=1 Tax=Utricularia reniformis TaxID=192314 RepID=A0A1Y0B211_9LAMI|nr:hypothetical protein AEK19_MT1227 [Utricularia reniformis]ART31440.1 hypothetical protein AEK19_MT1227 [Utricularia reniformis]